MLVIDNPETTLTVPRSGASLWGIAFWRMLRE